MSSLPFYLRQINQTKTPLLLNPINSLQYNNYSNNFPVYNSNTRPIDNVSSYLNDPRKPNQNEYKVFLDEQIEQAKQRKQKEKTDYDTNRSNSLFLNSIASNDPISLKEIQKKRQNEYQLILKQQIEEKEKRKQLEKQKRIDEDKRFEEEYRNYKQLQQVQDQDQKVLTPTPYHLRPNSNNKISITGNNIINFTPRKSIQSVSNGFDKQTVIAIDSSVPTSNINNQLSNQNKINTTSIDHELNNYIDDKFNEMQLKAFNKPQSTNAMPSFLKNSNASLIRNTQSSFNSKQSNLQIDNCVNEIISSKANSQLKKKDIPIYDDDINRLIDFSALDFRSKYEDQSTNCTNNKKERNNDTNENVDFEKSMKGNSKLVNTEYDKASGFLSTWKKNDLINTLKQSNLNNLNKNQSNLIKNAGEYILGSSQSHFYKKDIGSSCNKNNVMMQNTNKCIESIRNFTNDLLKSDNDNITFCNELTLKNNQLNLRDSLTNTILRPPMKWDQNDDLCNIRYSNDDYNDNRLELERKLKGINEDEQHNDFDDELGKIDFKDDYDNGDGMVIPKEEESTANNGIIEEDIGQSQSVTAKFPSRLDFFGQSNYGSFNLQQSQRQMVNDDDDCHKKSQSNFLIETINKIPNECSSNLKQFEHKYSDSIELGQDSQNEMYDKLLEDIDIYRQMAGTDQSPDIIPKRSKKDLK